MYTTIKNGLLSTSLLICLICTVPGMGTALAIENAASENSGLDPSVTPSIHTAEQERCNWPDVATLGAVVPIVGEDGSYASGVVFEQNRVLTAAHALSSRYRVFVNVDDEYRAARILSIDRHQDLAVLAVDTGAIQPLKIASTALAEQQAVWAVGFPRANARETSQGEFTRESLGALHTSAPIDLGQSGGGLLLCKNGAYELAGMLRGYGAYVSGDQFIKLENHSVSVAASTIQRFVAPAPVTTLSPLSRLQ